MPVVRIRRVDMLDTPILLDAALGTAVIVGVAALGVSLSSEDAAEEGSTRSIAELQSRIADARTSTAVAYREVSANDAEPAPEAQASHALLDPLLHVLPVTGPRSHA